MQGEGGVFCGRSALSAPGRGLAAVRAVLWGAGLRDDLDVPMAALPGKRMIFICGLQ